MGFAHFARGGCLATMIQITARESKNRYTTQSPMHHALA